MGFSKKEENSKNMEVKARPVVYTTTITLVMRFITAEKPTLDKQGRERS